MKTTRHDSFAAYVLPSVLAFALSGLYTIVDGFFIGQSLGDLGLAAITLAYPAAALLQAPKFRPVHGTTVIPAFAAFRSTSSVLSVIRLL